MKERLINIIALAAGAILVIAAIVTMSFRTPQVALYGYPIMAVCAITLAILRAVEYYQKRKRREETGGIASVIITAFVALYLVTSCLLPFFRF